MNSIKEDIWKCTWEVHSKVSARKLAFYLLCRCTRCHWQFRRASELFFISHGRTLVLGTNKRGYKLMSCSISTQCNKSSTNETTYISWKTSTSPPHGRMQNTGKQTTQTWPAKIHKNEGSSDGERYYTGDVMVQLYFSEHALAGPGRSVEGKSLHNRKK